MRLALLIAWVSIIGLVSGGCQIGNGDQQAEVESTPASPTASPATPEASPSPTATTNFSNPVTPPQTEDRVAVTGLIQTLPPETVEQQTQKGRSDPFAAITVQPVVTLPPTSGTPARQVRSLPQITQTTTPSRGRSRATGGRSRATGSSPSSVATRNNRLPSPPKTPTNRASTPQTEDKAGGGGSTAKTGNGADDLPVAVAPFVPELPVLPEPEQARGVEITGVIQVGGVPSAIVKVPNEPDRYVRVGQRLSNGQVLVKRIEMNRGPEPVVILEQYGIEVAKRVGDKSAGA
ncbi:MAG: hypothetical protein F6J89_17410 [Symploca sp. SIO1C4]|uniref:Uncharacterized protein n=1 Tax=Symploca sp. SIO1C4 TaxID=2607765 RepID=A0A6B3NJG6_9CYAN|nr:hypothetical protein [Symploca sp. SIO1C4]